MAGTLTPARPAWRGVAVGRPSTAPILLGVAALLLFTIALGQASLWDVDEALYATVAREMVRRGDLLTPYFNGRPWFDKPPLYMWLVAGTGALFGFNEFTTRVWVALFGTAGVLVTYLLGRRFYDARVGVLAGLTVMTTLEYFILARLAVLDVPLTVFMLLALYSVVVAAGAPSPAARRRAYRWGFVWAGLGTLVKGPVALLLPAMVVAAWWVARGEWRWRWRQLPWEGVLLYVLTGLTWYIVAAVMHGAPFVRAIVGVHWLQRFFGVVDNQPGPWYYYVPVVALGALPWTAFLPAAIAYQVRTMRQDGRSLLLLLWIGLIFLFYSVAGTKLVNYILPVYPVAAIVIARLWTAVIWERESRATAFLRWALVALPATLAAIALIGVAVPKSAMVWTVAWPSLRPIVPFPIAGGLLTVWLLARGSAKAAFAALAATMVVTYGLLVLVALPRVEALRPAKLLAQALRERVPPGSRLVAVGDAARPSLLFYTGIADSSAADAEAARQAICGPGEAFLVTTRPEYEEGLRSAFAGDAIVLMEQGDLVVLKKERFIPCASP